jgi:hypothetical protein
MSLYIQIKLKLARHQQLTPVILATWEGEIERIRVPGQLLPGNYEKFPEKLCEQNGLKLWLKLSEHLLRKDKVLSSNFSPTK